MTGLVLHAQPSANVSPIAEFAGFKERVSKVTFFGRELINGKVYWITAQGGKEDAIRVISKMAASCGLQDESFKEGEFSAGFAGEFMFFDSIGHKLGSLKHLDSLIVIQIAPKEASAYEPLREDTSSYVSNELEGGILGNNTWKVHIAEKKSQLPALK